MSNFLHDPKLSSFERENIFKAYTVSMMKFLKYIPPHEQLVISDLELCEAYNADIITYSLFGDFFRVKKCIRNSIRPTDALMDHTYDLLVKDCIKILDFYEAYSNKFPFARKLISIFANITFIK